MDNVCLVLRWIKNNLYSHFAALLEISAEISFRGWHACIYTDQIH